MLTNKKYKRGRFLLTFILTLLALSTIFLSPAGAEVKTSYLYNLSDFTGTIPFDTPRLSLYTDQNEIYVLSGNVVRVFNRSGMEIYRFGDDAGYDGIADLTLEEEGNIILLTYGELDALGVRPFAIRRCNFRGEQVGAISIQNAPARFAGFMPNRMIYRSGNIYLANLTQLLVLVIDREGNFRKSYDLIPLLDFEEKDRGNKEIAGFTVQEDGTLLFTIPVMFSAYRVSPEGDVESFGKPGSAPGKFNLVGGIDRDGRGNYFITDRLKSTVMVFDKTYKYIMQFGYRGKGKGNLVIPEDVAIDKNGRIFVTQRARRGVGVFQAFYD